MTATSMTISTNNGQFQPILPLDRATRDALATFCQQTFPASGIRKSVANEWGLTLDEARAVIEGRASAPTLDRIWKHPRGGWRVILPVLGAVVGQTADAFIIQEKQRLEHERRNYEAREARLVEMARDLRAVVPLRLGSDDRMAG